MKVFGTILLVVGIVMTIFTGFNLVTKEEVVDIGALEINKEENNPIYWSPITGGAIAIVGAVILVLGNRRKA